SKGMTSHSRFERLFSRSESGSSEIYSLGSGPRDRATRVPSLKRVFSALTKVLRLFRMSPAGGGGGGCLWSRYFLSCAGLFSRLALEGRLRDQRCHSFWEAARTKSARSSAGISASEARRVRIVVAVNSTATSSVNFLR